MLSETKANIIRGLQDATHECHKAAKQAGWWDTPRNDGELIALMHSELSEALEGIRKDSMDKHLPHRKAEEVELADAIHRIFDYAGAKGLDLGNALLEKMAYNARRADHRREARAAPGGKKF